MPELPEVEPFDRGLESFVVGKRIERVSVTGRRSVRRQSQASFKAALIGRTITSANRHGKWLYLGLGDDLHLVVHLRMSGALVIAHHDDALSPHTHIVIGFAGHDDELRFVDPRTFGEMFVSHEVGVAGRPIEIEGAGVDPLTGTLDDVALRQAMARRRVGLKAFLLDQRVIAGVGSIYADEIAFRCRLRPDRPVNTLKKADVARLSAETVSVLTKATELKGSSLRDESYRDVFGALGSYQHHHLVYGRAGEPCSTCGSPIAVIRVAGRSAHFCPSCQR